MSQKQNKLTQTGIVALLACVCCILWGSAIPVIKTGYHLLQVDSSDTASQIVFAGIRFTLAGILVLIFASIREKKVMLPDRTLLKYAIPVCLAQTVGQYFFFYIGVAHTSGVKGGIITGLGNFIAILLSCLVFRNERMTSQKIAGCVLGFAGVVVINLMGNSLDMGFKLIGEGFILIAQLSYGMSTVLINLFSKKVSPVVLSGTQFTMGGIVLTLIGIGMGGRLGNITTGGLSIIFYLALVSAVAYTLWSILLAWNDVSKVAIFGFVNPLCSVILSALILGEVKQAFNIHGDKASYDEIHNRIVSGAEIKGTNLCILVLAIFIASIGLNMNSTAVIIGAMLISPLMGGIMAIGYGIATVDFKMVRNSAVGLTIQVIACLIISSLYFAISPIKTASSEILARTSPTIWDVLIACFGGLAGIIGTTREEKSNVIPGVATALMPPLCTAGYGIANGSLSYFFGALYLIIIKTYFICLTSTIVLIALEVPKKEKHHASDHTFTKEAWLRLRHKIIRNTIILIIPSIFFAARLVQKETNENSGTYESEIDNINVERVTKELKLIYPQIHSLQIGYLFDYEKENGHTTETLTAIVKLKEPLEDNEKAKIKKILALEGDISHVEFTSPLSSASSSDNSSLKQ